MIQRIFRRIEFIDVRIQYEEGVGVPQGAQELTLSLDHGLIVETVRQPGRTVGVEIPTDRVRAVFSQCFKRIDRIALTLTHLLSVLILNMAQNDNVLIRRLVEQQG